MPTEAQQHTTPPEVAKHATQTVTLKPLALIGTFGPEAAPAALLRHPDGSIQSIKTGDTVEKETVAAISVDTVVLARGPRTRKLSLPQG